eukprot:TRINITY_DN5401_c1_g1_i1.p1 TRINITY_DN5401_c1_g1~~TRINITY_DN5401_c1_g1_i1.p1  ORF type:complete len:173 (+),score=39.77 TRINITY_DN5401_c1_g1_i1:500-1018(+)
MNPFPSRKPLIIGLSICLTWMSSTNTLHQHDLSTSSTLHALTPEEQDREYRARARALGFNIRCLVCQNQSIEDSNSEVAIQLREIVLMRIRGGDSDDQVMEYLVSEFGDKVLYAPPLDMQTGVLYGFPLILLTAVGLGSVLRKKPSRIRQVEAADGMKFQRLTKLTGEKARR